MLTATYNRTVVAIFSKDESTPILFCLVPARAVQHGQGLDAISLFLSHSMHSAKGCFPCFNMSGLKPRYLCPPNKIEKTYNREDAMITSSGPSPTTLGCQTPLYKYNTTLSPLARKKNAISLCQALCFSRTCLLVDVNPFTHTFRKTTNKNPKRNSWNTSSQHHGMVPPPYCQLPVKLPKTQDA